MLVIAIVIVNPSGESQLSRSDFWIVLCYFQRRYLRISVSFYHCYLLSLLFSLFFPPFPSRKLDIFAEAGSSQEGGGSGKTAPVFPPSSAAQRPGKGGGVNFTFPTLPDH